MARNKMLGTLLICGLFCFFLAQNAGAQQIELEHSITAYTANGDFTTTTGFAISGDVTFKGVALGTISFNILDTTGVVDYSLGYEEFTLEGTLDITGFGTCDLDGMLYSMPAVVGGYDTILSYAATMSNCTDSLSGLAGVISASGVNPFSSDGAVDFILQISK